MEITNFENVYTHCSVNRYPHCIDCKNKIICFATSNSIAIYDLTKRKVVELCNRHTGLVNSVRWIGFNEKYFISSSIDKSCIIWKYVGDYQYEVNYVLFNKNNDVVIVSDSINYETENGISFFSVSSHNDQTLCFWKDDILLQSKEVKGFVFDVKIFNQLLIPGIVVLTAGSNELVNIHRFNIKNNQLDLLITLKGHNDWIKSIDLYQLKNDRIMLASASQDFLIRVYNIMQSDENVDLHQQSFVLNDNAENHKKFVVNLETVLSGHEGWVTNVKWHFHEEKLYLLSSSMDKTIVLWEQMGNDVDCIWNEKVRFGEVGGNAIGFIDCFTIPSLNMIAGHSFNGAVNLWKHDTSSDHWKASFSITGHFDEVTDLVWEPEGEFFLTCSTDQTTRLHIEWFHDGTASWHEIGRPQIHGYDLKCLAMAGRFKFISGADEKVIRIFNATKYVVESLQQITGNEYSVNESNDASQLAECAMVPALGLSNSAVYDRNQISDEFNSKLFNIPPTEEILLQNTLWNETQKLYGHGYEIFAIAVNNKASLLASACKASSMTHAAIILWDLETCKQLSQLVSHNLTVTQVCFSPDDRFLLSVSRDRTWALFDMTSENGEYTRIAFSNKKTGIHSRIIWDCAWTPDSRVFLTSSRDKSVVVWELADKNTSTDPSQLINVNSSHVLNLDDSVTSVDIHHCLISPYLVCLALENGQLLIFSLDLSSGWKKLFDLKCHTKSINRIRFSPKLDEHSNGNVSTYVASCSADYSSRLYLINLSKL